jgi:hypothetical protein
MWNDRSRFMILAGLACFLASACDQQDASQPSLEGYWELVSNHDNATGITAPVAPGTAVLHYRGGVIEMYLNDGTTKGCGSNTYTLQGNAIHYGTGGDPNLMEVTASTLRLTALKNGTPIGYSDFVRLPTFSAEGYGTCKSSSSGADAG